MMSDLLFDFEALSKSKNKENIMKLNVIKECAEYQKNILTSERNFYVLL